MCFRKKNHNAVCLESQDHILLKHSGTYAHTFDKAFVIVMGISMDSFMTLVLVRQYFCSMKKKKTLMITIFISFTALGNG